MEVRSTELPRGLRKVFAGNSTHGFQFRLPVSTPCGPATTATPTERASHGRRVRRLHGRARPWQHRQHQFHAGRHRAGLLPLRGPEHDGAAVEHADRDGLTEACGKETHAKIQRVLSEPLHVAVVFTGRPGKYVSVEETVRGFREIAEGKHDDKPEQAFYMVGGIEEVVQRAEELKEL
jgi:hypothetical protein